jgi:hypothetical protein
MKAISTPDSTKMVGLRVKRVMRYDKSQRKLRLFRLLWSRGSVGDGVGYSAKLAVSLVRKWAGWKRDTFGWRLTVLGVQLHHRRAYGGWIV